MRQIRRLADWWATFLNDMGPLGWVLLGYFFFIMLVFDIQVTFFP